MQNKKYLIVLVGATAVGKTKLSIELAQYYNSEIISADSRQLYKELSIGTAKISKLEMQGIKHHFIDSHSIKDYFSIGDFEKQANKIIEEIFKTNQFAVVAGGSGMFIKALLEGIDEMPQADLNLRAVLNQKLEDFGLEWFKTKLEILDNETFKSIELNNVQRVFRAVEVSIQTGKPYSSFLNKEKTTKDYSIIKIGLERPRPELYERINNRVDEMIEAGLIEEVESLKEFKNLNGLQTVGYKEVFDYFENKYTFDEMVEKIKQNSRKYAKRQTTWFKNQDEFNWFHPDSLTEIISFIENSSRI